MLKPFFRILFSVSTLAALILNVFFTPSVVKAQRIISGSCSLTFRSEKGEVDPLNHLVDNAYPFEQLFFNITVTDNQPDVKYKLILRKAGWTPGQEISRELKSRSDGVLVETTSSDPAAIDGTTQLPGIRYSPSKDPAVSLDEKNRQFRREVQQHAELFKTGQHEITLLRQRPGEGEREYCKMSYDINADASGGVSACKLTFDPADPDETKPIKVKGNITPPGVYQLLLPGNRTIPIRLNPTGDFEQDLGTFGPTLVSVTVQKRQGAGGQFQDTNCIASCQVGRSGTPGKCEQIGEAGTKAAPPPGCAAGSSGCSKSEPQPCTGGTGVLTAIGCVPTEPKALVEGILRYGTFAAGGIAFLIMILASLQMITAEGNPDSLKNARDKFYSAIIGLLFIIFSALLIQIIGVDILGLKGFG